MSWSLWFCPIRRAITILLRYPLSFFVAVRFSFCVAQTYFKVKKSAKTWGQPNMIMKCRKTTLRRRREAEAHSWSLQRRRMWKPGVRSSPFFSLRQFCSTRHPFAKTPHDFVLAKNSISHLSKFLKRRRQHATPTPWKSLPCEEIRLRAINEDSGSAIDGV